MCESIMYVSQRCVRVNYVWVSEMCASQLCMCVKDVCESIMYVCQRCVCEMHANECRISRLWEAFRLTRQARQCMSHWCVTCHIGVWPITIANLLGSWGNARNVSRYADLWPRCVYAWHHDDWYSNTTKRKRSSTTHSGTHTRQRRANQDGAAASSGSLPVDKGADRGVSHQDNLK